WSHRQFLPAWWRLACSRSTHFASELLLSGGAGNANPHRIADDRSPNRTGSTPKASIPLQEWSAVDIACIHPERQWKATVLPDSGRSGKRYGIPSLCPDGPTSRWRVSLLWIARP